MHHGRTRTLARSTLTLLLLLSLGFAIPADGSSATASGRSRRWHRNRNANQPPTVTPSTEPTIVPSVEPTVPLSVEPTIVPSVEPPAETTVEPIAAPPVEPAVEPAVEPSTEPTAGATVEPVTEPTIDPVVSPSEPAVEPTVTTQPAPIAEPEPAPVVAPTPAPTPAPIPTPQPAPAPAPAPAPTPAPAPAPATDFFVGAYVPGAPLSITPVRELQTKLGSNLSVVNYFQNTSQGFTLTQATNAANNGSIPLITLEFWDPAKGVDQPGYSLKSISGGAWDAYLHRYARDAKAFGKTVWLRPLHEMNGNWYPWGGTVNGNSPSDFAGAWRHMRDIFAEEGATNVKFVWCPNNDSVPATSANAIASYWPGDAYVDYVAIDGYNFGTGSSWSTWRSFSSVFGAAYSTVTKLSTKPVIIAEMGCSTSGGDKTAWIDNMFDVLPTNFSRVIGVVWFNADKERDWRIESSPESLQAFKAGFSSLP